MKASIKSVKPKLASCSFGPYDNDLFQIYEGADLIEALDVGADLADGISQICSRLDAVINDGGVIHCSEVRAIAFLGSAASALVRSAERGLAHAAKDGGVQ